MITIESLIRTASGMASGVIAVAAAHDEEVLKAVCEAKRKNIANAILVGNVIRIKSILSELGEEDSGFELIPADSDADCAAKAVSAVRSGRANLLMKGILNTADLMRAVLDKENGIRTERLISHVMLYQPAGYRLMAVTDGGMNPFPDLGVFWPIPSLTDTLMIGDATGATREKGQKIVEKGLERMIAFLKQW